MAITTVGHHRSTGAKDSNSGKHSLSTKPGFNPTILNAAEIDSHDRILRPISSQHHQNPRIIGPLTVEETQEANTRILKAVQGLEFATAITALTNKDMRYKGRLGTHYQVVDEIDLLRVGGGWHTQQSHQTHATQSSYQPSITSPNW